MKKYINQFFSLKSATELLPFFQLSHTSAAKEITESFTCFKAAIDVLKLNYKEPRHLIVVGDGATPRTAALFVYLTRWLCHSIDPNFTVSKTEKAMGDTHNLIWYKAQAQKVKIDCEGLPATIILPHAHVGLEIAKQVPQNYSNLNAVAVPCCYPIEEKFLHKDFAKEHNLKVYTDPDCWSPKRTVYCWENL